MPDPIQYSDCLVCGAQYITDDDYDLCPGCRQLDKYQLNTHGILRKLWR